MARKPWIVPIPGTTQMAHMLESAGAMQLVISPGGLDEMDAELDAIEVRGQRLPDWVLAFSGIEAPMPQ